MNRKEILDSAAKCVCGDRDQQCGGPEESFRMIAEHMRGLVACEESQEDA